MAIKSILVHIDNSEACKHRINAAIALANRHQAQFAAVCVVETHFIPAYVDVHIAPEIIEEVTEKARERAREAVTKFEGVVNDAKLSANTYTVEGNLISILCDYARYADLLVLGQSDPQDPDNMSESLADKVVMEAGTPCLVIPCDGISDALGKKVLVAWNASRESARALKDAMPVLEHAEHVEVLSIDTQHAESDDEKLSDNEITTYMEQHDIDMESHVKCCKTSDIGNVILSHASDMGADMIVMGAYGHSRLRELVLGGVTKHVLKHATIPSFVSH